MAIRIVVARVSGDVGCSVSTMSLLEAPRLRSMGRFLNIFVSSVSSGGVSICSVTTSAPDLYATSAISSLSVITITRSRDRTSRAVLIEWTIRGTPATIRRFFRGTPTEPPRAGIINQAVCIEDLPAASISSSAIVLVPVCRYHEDVNITLWVRCHKSPLEAPFHVCRCCLYGGYRLWFQRSQVLCAMVR